MTLDRLHFTIPFKANKVLNIFLIALFFIVLRVWYLSVIQYDQRVEESRKPQRRSIVKSAKRGTIRDRFNYPLALNQVHYNAAIIYAPLKQIPALGWSIDKGKKQRYFKRKAYVAALAQLLGKELALDPERLEDLIYSKAALYYNLPFVIKEDISEKEYYRLKMLEKEWIGIHTQLTSKRCYPYGKVAGDLIGYMGAINRQEYEAILEEMQTLEIYLRECDEGVTPEWLGGALTPIEAAKRLQDLQEYAYNLNDYVGKTGIEGRFEQILRGYQGQKIYSSDARGNFLRELPGFRKALSGHRLLLTLSVELQEYAEKLLAQNERIREPKAARPDSTKQTLFGLRQPWIKGGGIVAMDPKTGEILAMASYPRIDPNDFISSGQVEKHRQKQSHIGRWFESETYLAELWDQKTDLEKELFDDNQQRFYEEQKKIDWEGYLSFILPQQSPILTTLNRLDTVADAVKIQLVFERLLLLSGQTNSYYAVNSLYTEQGHTFYGNRNEEELKKIDKRFKLQPQTIAHLKKQLDYFFLSLSSNYDKVLLVDLYRLSVQANSFSTEILKKLGKIKLATYRDMSADKEKILELTKKMAKEIFHDQQFKIWRSKNEKIFLKEKRALEKLNHQYAKPYLDYLDSQENEDFQNFWKQHAKEFLLAFLCGTVSEQVDLQPYFVYYLQWHQEIKQGAHTQLTWFSSYRHLQQNLQSLNQEVASNFLDTMRGFKDLNRPLLGSYKQLRKKGGVQIEKSLATAFYPIKGFNYSRSQLYRQVSPLGSIFKVITAYAALKQLYLDFKEKGELTAVQLNPLEMIDHTHRRVKDLYVGFHADGKPLPRAYKGGRLPKSTRSIGKIDLNKALETSSNPYFSLLAGDILKNPEDLAEAARQFSFGQKTGIELPAELPGYIPTDLTTNRTGLYATAIGQHTLGVTPLQTAVMLAALSNGGKILKPKIVKLTLGGKPKRKNIQNLLFYKQETAPLVVSENSIPHLINQYPTTIQREIFLPPVIRQILLEGMHRVVIKTQEESLAALSHFYKNYPEAISDYLELREELVGKTSTAETVENLNLDLTTGTNLYTHVWFGGIAFDHTKNVKKLTFHDRFGEPELVVVIYLRYGAYGKEAAPLAAQIVRKWREIKEKEQKTQLLKAVF